MSIWKSKKASAAQPVEDEVIDFVKAEERLRTDSPSSSYTPPPPPQEEKHGRIWHLIDNLVTRESERVKQPVKKKTYLWLCLLGAFGAHRFYSKRWVLGLIYLLTCWTGWSVAMTFVDLIIIIPMKPDENGIVYI